MAAALNDLVRTVRRAAEADQLAAESDAALLDRLHPTWDAAAFEALVRRHARAVQAACRAVLRDDADVQDAFQATFLVLLRNARSVRRGSPLGRWLYGVARKVALKAKARTAAAGKREARSAKPEATPAVDPGWRETCDLLHRELARLPVTFRRPLELCYLDGLTRDEAAAALGVTAGTVKGRLERGRVLLRERLEKRGVALSVGLLALALMNSAAAVSPRVVSAVLSAASGTASPTVAALAEGFIVTGTKTTLSLLAVLAVGVLGIGGWMTSGATAKTDDKPAVKADVPKPAKDTPERIAVHVVDADGKPVAGATVYRRGYTFMRELPAEANVGKTGADGKLETERKLFASFHATADGYCTSSSGYLTEVNPVTIRLAKPHPIKGRLVDLQGKPVPNAKVIVEQVSAAENDDLTAAYNAYRVNPDHTWDATALHLDGKATGAPKGTTTDADGRFELTGVGLRRVVQLRFVADGIETARVTVFADPKFAERSKPRTDAEKKMSGMTGDYRAATHGPEFTHAARPDHVITGTITDAITGKPVTGAKVAGTTSHVGSAFVGSPWHDQVETTTDADGKFRLAGLVKAKVRTLHVMGSDTAPYLDHIVEVADTDGYTPAVADVKLQPAVVVQGQLVNVANGKPVAGSAQWLPLTTNEPLLKGDDDDARLYTSQLGNTWPSGTRADAGADGRFTLRVPTGPGVVLARADLFDPTAVFTPLRVRAEDRKHLRKQEKDPDVIDAGGPKDRDGEEYFDTIMLLAPLRWENGYAVVNPDGTAKAVEPKVEFDPGTTVTLAATDPDGKPLGGVTVVGPGGYGLRPPTFAKPEVAVGGIDPKGRPVQLYLLHKDRKLCAAVTVKGDEKGPVAVKMQPCGSVTGKVVDHTGKPVKGARVMFQMTDAVADDLLRQKLYRGAAEVATDADGKFTFPSLFPDVEFGLHVSMPGFRFGAAESKRTKVKPGETTDVGEFKCRDPKKIDDE